MTTIKKSAAKTKTKVKEVLNQAKASLRILEALEKETRSATSEKLFTALKKMGIATADDVESLRIRLENLEAEVAAIRSSQGASVGENIPQG